MEQIKKTLQDLQNLNANEVELLRSFEEIYFQGSKMKTIDCYDGDNRFGIGQVSFENAPEFDPRVACTFWKAAGFIYGRPQLKVIFVEGSDPRHGTDFELPIWIDEQLRDLEPGWNEWKERAWKGVLRLNRKGRIRTTSDWWDAFQELAAGIESKGPIEQLVQRKLDRLFARLLGIHGERNRHLLWIKSDFTKLESQAGSM